MSKLPKLNKALLRKVKRHLIAEPRRYDQRSWGKHADPAWGGPACGTQGCIAGWAVFLSKPPNRWSYWKKNYENIAGEARKLLGTTEEEFLALSDAGNQDGHVVDVDGVEQAVRKIDDLIADRAAFVEKW